MTAEPGTSTRELIARLSRIRSTFSRAAAGEKRRILELLDDRDVRAPHLLKRLHDVLCYLRAFPDDRTVLAAVERALVSFEQRIARLRSHQRRALDDTGIAGTRVCHVYSYPVADWLSSRFPETSEIDWPAYEDPETLDDILVHFIFHAEDEIFGGGEISTREWIRQAKSGLEMSDLAWLMTQLRHGAHLERLREQLYDKAEVPVVWRLDGPNCGRMKNRYGASTVATRSQGMRRVSNKPLAEISKPLRKLQRVPARRGREIIDVSMSALAMRHREVYSMNHANPEEVYVADTGFGTQVAVMGVLPEYRLSLESNYGYIIMSNGVPVGYGGSTTLFCQANTGIHVFDEFRRSEATYLFVQTLRVLRSLFECTRFIVNPYQFGSENREAIDSGAFWFYYRLGFRPVDRELERLARGEYQRLSSGRTKRSTAAMLKTLSGGDLQLRLKDAKAGQFFPERWLGVCSLGATRLIGQRESHTRVRGIPRILSDVSRHLSIRSRRTWSAQQRAAFERLAPIVGLISDLKDWPASDKRSLVQLIRAKGGKQELPHVLRVGKHERFRKAMIDYSRRAERRA